MFKILTPLFALMLLPGCSSLIASATGPEPIGKAAGERTFSMSLQDSGIETTAEVNIIKSDERFRDANVNVVSFYNSVLLAGQVPTEDMKQKAEQVVRTIAEVRQIHNELTVGDVSYYGERTSDGLISTRLRTAYTLEKGFPSSRLKVFTVGGTVYLLGKLTTAEAEQAVLIASQLAGVKKIIKMIDPLPAPAPINIDS